MEYRDAEAFLAELHQIDEEAMGAFRARLRVLRSMGIPPLPKVGKGARVEFSTGGIAELHLALTLGEFGLPPARIVQIVGAVRCLSSWPPRRTAQRRWLAVTMRGEPGSQEQFDRRQGETLRVRVASDAALLEELDQPTQCTTWRAVLDLGRLAEDLADLG